METQSYKQATNKEKFLEEVVKTEFYGAQLGSALAVPQYEIASEIGLSSFAKYTIPGATKVLGNRPRAGLFTGIVVATPIFGASEGKATFVSMAQAMRINPSSQDIFNAQVQGVASATTINALIGFGLPFAKTPFKKEVKETIEGGLSSTKKVAIAQAESTKKMNLVGKLSYYGGKVGGYAYDIPEAGIDFALEHTKVKSFLGLDISLPAATFIGAPTTSKTTSKVQSQNSLSNKSITKGFGSAVQVGSNLPVPSNAQTDTDVPPIGGETNINTGGNTDTGGIIDNSVQNQTQTNINTSTQTDSTVNVNIPTIVSPRFPGLLPFLPFGDAGEPYKAGSGKRKGTKYYNELEQAFKSFKGLDFGLVPSKRRRRTVTVGGKTYRLGKQVKRK